MTTAYGYDSNDRVNDIVTEDPGGDTLASFDYTLDGTGIPTSVEQQLTTWDTGTSERVLTSPSISYRLDGAPAPWRGFA